MSAMTGRAAGSLSPIIYFERADGKIDLPVFETGHPEMARQVFESHRYKYHPVEKWEYRETGTQISDIRAFQKRLVDQENRIAESMKCNHQMMRERVRKDIASSLYQQLQSSDISEYNKDFIRHYLLLREEKDRDKYGQAFEHRQAYLWALENDSNTQIIDRAPDQPGDFWRTPEQQKS